ncbi:probable serine/threonine-protein kinase PIX13 isoform X2 [Morus notabilis]|uniref:probable serine/threonine-protein kinase PIX13 isoform X2 n=1 Tax=Morus notabilis TaxID=981085 RepID=UPI000CED0B29|nr:probable serine/threonine-protein kinase PIX13 isoform X2 [Morus notabilis]
MGNCLFKASSEDNPTQSIQIKPPNNPPDDQNSHAPTAIGGERSGRNTSPPLINGRSTLLMEPSLKVFTLAELKAATKEFRSDTFLGEGGFGEVFKGWIDEKTYAPSTVDGIGVPVAVKRSKFPYSCQGPKEGKAEVKFLAKFSHPNLVKLLGFCWEENQFLLVYEYMPKGSLDKHLFMRASVEALSWDMRLKIATGAARGLAFLHNSESSEKSVIYRDFKTSNILLDEEYNAKLSDFGLAKFGPIDGKSHVTTRVIGTHGYAAPEYVATGHLYVKSDVYGFGVVLLEMLTGRHAIDEFRPVEEIELVKWARPYLNDKKKLKKIMDQRLENLYPRRGAWEAAKLVRKCLQYDRNNRPSMKEVLETLENINPIIQG